MVLHFSQSIQGEQTIIGRGAGGMETASAMLRDLIEIRDGTFSRNIADNSL